MNNAIFARVATIVVILLAMTGCGTKGPLTMPQSPQPNSPEQGSVQTVSSDQNDIQQE